MTTLLIDRVDNRIISYGDTVVLYDIYALVDGGNTIADYGVERAYTATVESLPDDISFIPAEPTHKYIDGEIVPIEPAE